MDNVLKSNWRSNEDLLDGCMASAFIPCYSFFTASAKFRGQRYVDGSLYAGLGLDLWIVFPALLNPPSPGNTLY